MQENTSQVDVSYLEKSVLILTPKPQFFIWLSEMVKERGWSFESIYFPEYNPVYLISSVDSFSTTGAFDAYIANIKPLLLQHGISGYGFGPLQEYSVEMFDKFFEIELRDRVMNIDNDF